MSDDLDARGVFEDVTDEPTPEFKQVRAWEVRIDNPLNGNPTLIYRTEKVVLDANSKLIYRDDRRTVPDISTKFSDVAMDLITIKDPVTQQNVTISGAAVAESIAVFFAKTWNKQKGS
jgi:hypothetical protein